MLIGEECGKCFSSLCGVSHKIHSYPEEDFMSKVLQLFSGGRDSMLSVCRLLEVEDTQVVLANFINGCTVGIDNVQHGIDRLVERYGDRVSSLGTYDVSWVWRELLKPVMNKSASEILSDYGEITYSQLNCMTCRLAMYVYAIAICQEQGITEISDGARYSQNFVVESKAMLQCISSLLKKIDIDLLTPVAHVSANWERKNDLLRYGFVPKVLEQQCLMGMPLDREVPSTVQAGVIAYFDKEVAPRVITLVDKVRLSRDSILL